MASDYAVFLEYLQSQTLDWLSQLVEEGVIYAFDLAKQGIALNAEDSYLFRFLKLSLEFFDLAVSKNFAEFLPSIRDNLRKIFSRFDKIV